MNTTLTLRTSLSSLAAALTIAMLPTTASAATQVPPINTERIVKMAECTNAEQLATRAANVTISIKLDYQKGKQMPQSVTIFDTEVVASESCYSSQKEVICSIPQGTYQIYATFYDTTTNAYWFGILEDVAVEDGASYNIRTSDIKNHISFRMLLPDGTEATLNNLDANTEGTILGTIDNQFISHEDFGHIFYSSGGNVEICAADYALGDEMYDFWVSDVSDRWTFAQTRIAIPIGAYDETDCQLYTAFWAQRGADKSMDLYNDITTYSTNGHKEYFTTTPRSKDYEYSHPAYCFTMIHKGIPSLFASLYSWDALPSSRLNHSFMEGYSEETHTVVPSFALVWNETDDIINGYSKYVAKPGGGEYPMNAYMGDKMIYNWLVLDDDDNIEYSVYPGHPVLSVDGNDVDYIMGNSVPIYTVRLSNILDATGMNVDCYGTVKGRLDEERSGDIIEARYSLFHNGAPIDYTGTSWYYWLVGNGDYTGDYELDITNINVAAANVYGVSELKMKWNYDGDDMTPPTIQALQFRDADNRLTDYIADLNGAKMLIAAGDYDYTKGVSYNTYEHDYYLYQKKSNPLTINVEYATHGTEDWKEIEAIQLSEYDDMSAFGRTFSVDLGNVETYSTGTPEWIDVRFRVTDAAGNYSEHLVAPAFQAYGEGSGNDNPGNPNDPGSGISTTENSKVLKAIYTTDGRMVSNTATPGIYILRYSDGTTEKIMNK